jgi:hypothetical protein
MRQSLAEWINQRAGMQLRGDTKPSPNRSPDNELHRYQERVKQLLSIAKQQAFELSSERNKRQRAEIDLAKVRSRLKASERSRRQNRRTLRRASRELNSLRRGGELPAVIELRQQIGRIQQQYVDALVAEQTSLAQAESELKAVEKERERLRKALIERKIPDNPPMSARVADERDRRRKAEKESRNLKRKLRHASRSLNTLRRDHSKCGKRSFPASSNGTVAKHDFIGVILPNLTLARDGYTRLTQARDIRQVFDDLARLNDSPQVMRGERVGTAEPWFEIRPTLTDRVYYRQLNGRGRYLVLIGDKNSQNNDLGWMRKNRRGGL